LPLDISSTVDTPLPLGLVKRDQEQIANHLRVVVSTGVGIENIRGIAASEPILSEAASLVMNDLIRFNLPMALSRILLEEYATDSEDRAELLVAALFTDARDKAVLGETLAEGQVTTYFSVTKLFENLFSPKTYRTISEVMPSIKPRMVPSQSFGTTFGKAYVHFNHFIKPQKRSLMYRPFLLRSLARDAAVSGANGQRGVDAIYPFLYGTKELDDNNVGFILVQVRTNDVSEKARAGISREMDPYYCNLLLDDEGEDETFPIPIIRIVFALINKNPGFTPQPNEKTSDGHFTSYDFWCSGLSPDILRPVQKEPDHWREIARKADRCETYYSAASYPDVLRSQFLGVPITRRTLMPGHDHDPLPPPTLALKLENKLRSESARSVQDEIRKHYVK
jgi:hypothetical protein